MNLPSVVLSSAHFFSQDSRGYLEDYELKARGECGESITRSNDACVGFGLFRDSVV
jgi:hypothetical protein